MNPIEKLAFCGEQILSYLDDIRRTPCPRCQHGILTPESIGKDMIIRCSVPLHDYNNEEEEAVVSNVCSYVQHIKSTSIAGEPFTLRFSDSRPTAKNIPKPPTRRKRPSA
jgi:hypothetical protein